MADKIFDRAFNKVLAGQNREEEKLEARRQPTQQEVEAEEAKALRAEALPMSTQDAIKRMVLADRDKDYFRQEKRVSGTAGLHARVSVVLSSLASTCIIQDVFWQAQVNLSEKKY
jgi:hypothetical protein